MWMLPLYLHVNQKSDYDMIYDIEKTPFSQKGSVLKGKKFLTELVAQ